MQAPLNEVIGQFSAYGSSLARPASTIQQLGAGGVQVGDNPDMAKLDMNGDAYRFFQPFANGTVFAIAVQTDGKILVGSAFTTIGGPRIGFVRLTDDTGSALQNLAVTQTTATWTLVGSSPQFARVTFESSTDHVNYNSLGNGTMTGSNWTLMGLTLPTGQNLYIRARGYSLSSNGSQSIQESVRNAYLSLYLATPQPLLKIQCSASTNVVLSWGTNFPGFTLESNTNLTTNVWSIVFPAPVTGHFKTSHSRALQNRPV